MTRVTEELAGWAAGLRYEDLPAEVVHHAKRVLLDYVGATLLGSTSSSARIVQQYLGETSDRGPATVLGTSLELGPASAALANGTAAHGMEVDDGYSPGSFHPGAPNLAAILAVGQARMSDPDRILLATAVGFELSCRIAAVGHPATWRRGFHNTPLAGVFGAAASVATLLETDAMTMASALGLAGSHAGGLFEFLAAGSEVKRLHAGKAARDGIVCAELAARGLTGPATVLEGANGYLRAFAGGEVRADDLLRDLGTRWRMLRTYVKPYPCCRHLHGPIDAVLALADDGAVDTSSVRSVTVETYDVAARHDAKAIGGLLDAQMSIPYAVAVTLTHGRPGVAHFESEFRDDPDVRRLVDLVEVREAADCIRAYPAERRARLTFRTVHGERSVQVDHPYGEPDNPVSDRDLERKFLGLASPVVGADRAARIAANVWAFDESGALAALGEDTRVRART
ncbi:MmgE/PrpD family protein [Actinophytocola sp.]|uniref:MmgE/PrpD family protein n=1 Tax=Actinophytocola sp. TaxID=1872138 RepID=UPI003D6C068B